MEIRFTTVELAKLCNCAASIDKKWGKQLGAALRQRLFLLAGTPTLELLREFTGLLVEPIKLDPHGCLAVVVGSDCALWIQPDYAPIPFLRNQELDCAKIKRLVIVGVSKNER